MFPKFNLSQDEVPPFLKNGDPNPEFPHDGKCKSGHIAPPGTRFFKVYGESMAPGRAGTYCEPCLIVANKRHRRRKEGRESPLPPHIELAVEIEKVRRRNNGGG